jgi:toxin ParE1/3/4
MTGTRRFEVLLTAGAERDLQDIHEAVLERSGEHRANSLLEDLVNQTDALAAHPERGAHPKELLALGIKEYRQVTVHTYRAIFRVMDARVIIVLIADGRRDMRSILAKRLLER